MDLKDFSPQATKKWSAPSGQKSYKSSQIIQIGTAPKGAVPMVIVCKARERKSYKSVLTNRKKI